MRLGDIKTGARVRDQNGREGVVVRETFAAEVGNPVHRHMPIAEHQGVMWDGDDFVVEYGPDRELELIDGD